MNANLPYQPLRPARALSLPVRDLHVHVHAWGTDAAHASAPPVLLLHGWMDVGASFQFLVDALDAGFLAPRAVLAPDWRGFGGTAVQADHFTFVDYLADLDTLIDRLAGAQPVDLVGHSMGGNIAMLYAGVRPQRVRRLVNLEGFGLPATTPTQAPGRYALWLDQLKAQARGEGALRPYPSLDAVAARLMKNNPRLPAPQARWLAGQWAERRTDGQWHLRAHPAHKVSSAQLYRADEAQAVHRAIRAPVLFIDAADDTLPALFGPHLGRAELNQRLAAVPHLTHQRLPDCGHMLHHDQPQALARLVEGFLSAG